MPAGDDVHATRRGGARHEVSSRVTLTGKSGEVYEGWALNVLGFLGDLSYWQGEYAVAQSLLEQSLALARELALAGADPAHCARGIYFAHSVAKIRLLGEALRSLNVEGHIGYAWVTHEQMEACGAIEEDCEGLVNYVLSIGGVEVAAFFRELPDGRYRVSLRSKGKLNVAHVAERFGGGGHECASGCSVNGPLTEAVRQVLFQLRGEPSVQ